MKKILSVALSTAMAFSMFASVAFGDTAVTPESKFDALKDKGIFTGYPDGLAHLEKEMTRAEFAKVITKVLGLKEVTGVLSYTDKNYTAKNWAVPYIEAVSAAGIMEGKNVTKKIFDFNGNVTVEELATVLVRALELEVPTTVDNSASTWAKGYVQAAINAGLVAQSSNFQANASRSLLVEAAYAVDEIVSIPTVASYVVSDGGKVVEFTLSNKEVVKVTLEKALEANKETEVTFKNTAGQEITTKVTYVVTTATKVEKVSASNLKEVVVAFDGKVDKDSAENAANYTFRSGKIVDSVALSDDEKTATILLKDGSVLSNNKIDAVSVANVKAGDKVISATNVEFSIVDNVLPEVSSVKSLGTKSLKVVFSEPVKNIVQSNFSLDGKEFFGKVTVSNNFRTVVLTPFSSTALAVGDHKVTTSGVKDFADFVSLASTHEFTVVEDTAAPTISEATATLESVTITYSEDVDVDTIDVNKVYWKSGSDKIKAVSKKQLADNKFRYDFGADRSLPTGSVSIFVEGVKDYSGNEIAKDTSVVVTPVIDQTRPEVTTVTGENARQIKINFSKTINKVSAEKTANYTVKDKDGKSITVKDAALDPKDSRIVYVNLYTDLSVGDNTLTIQNVKDDTKLQNTILDFTGKVNLADKAAPTIDSATVNTGDRRVVIKFNKKLDIESLANYSNYLVEIDGKTQSLTSNIAEISPLQDGSAVAIKFADSINGKTVRLASGTAAAGETHITELRILGVKDANGNVLKEFTDNKSENFVDLTKTTVVGLGDNAELIDRRTVKVKFNAGIYSYASSAFVNTGTNAPAVSSIDVDGTSTVTVNFASDLATDGSDLNLNVNLAQLTTTAGSVAGTGTLHVTGTNVTDKVKPVVLNNDVDYVAATNSFTINFSEVIKADSNALAAADFTIIRNTDNKELKATENDFTVNVSGNIVTVTLNDSNSRTETSSYRVEVKNGKFITDNAGNVLADFTGKSAAVTGVAAPTLTVTKATYNNTDGLISGLDATKLYEYKLSTATTYTSVAATATSITVAAGKYDVRVAAVGTTSAGAVTTVTVGQVAATDIIAAAQDASDLSTSLLVANPTANASIALPATGYNGSTITWVASSQSVSSVLTPVRDAGATTTIQLTATVKKGTATKQVTFTVTVPATGAVTVSPGSVS